MSTFSIWILVKRDRGGYLVSVSAIPLGAGEYAAVREHLSDSYSTLEAAKLGGEELAVLMNQHILARGDEVISRDTTIDDG